MELEKFLNKYSNEIISNELLSNMYNFCDLSNEANISDFEILFPIIKELYYYKTDYPKIILKNYENKDTLKNNLNEEYYFIYYLLDKGIGIDEIINFQIKSMKKIVCKTLTDCICTGKQPYKIVSDLKEKIQKLLIEEVSMDEIVIEAFKGTYEINRKFDLLCKFLNL